MEPNEPKHTVLIVDDDRNTRDGLERALASSWSVFTAENATRALAILSERQVDVLLVDLRMPGMDGMELMEKALGMCPGVIAIVLTAYGSVETAVEAVKLGAYDFLTKPINLDHLELVLQRAVRTRRIESENERLRRELNDRYGLENIIGDSAPMRVVFQTVKRVAPTQATVLIQGESGTGKELVAHAPHRLSPRAAMPFVAVHCAALAPTLLESELFGHEKGAFTGATAMRRGRFEAADSGTLFLDEISAIDQSTQIKLLRVLEERSFERVGGTDTIKVDIRLIAATNRSLKAMVHEGGFREDLFFRLDVVTINLPPLRERHDDIPLLCRHFLGEFAKKHGVAVEGITPEAVEILSAYKWPGNVRELRNTIEKMVVLAGARKLTVRDIPQNIRNAVRPRLGFSLRAAAEGPEILTLAEAEKLLIQAALERNRGNRTKAAAELGISRRTMQRKLKEYKLDQADEPPHPASA